MTAAKSDKPMILRQRATAATQERFRGKAFAWGSVDCAKLAAFHLRQLGHKVRLSKAGSYKTAVGARGALKRMGFANLVQAMDAHLPRHAAPAFALIGDVVSFCGDDPIGALGIVVGNGNMLAFHESHDLPVIMSMGQVDIAWSAIGPGLGLGLGMDTSI